MHRPSAYTPPPGSSTEELYHIGIAQLWAAACHEGHGQNRQKRQIAFPAGS
jgi:hypothetical protein